MPCSYPECKKKVPLAFQVSPCKCSKVFCSAHRMPEEHACGYDYKSAAKEQLIKLNPLVSAKKVDVI